MGDLLDRAIAFASEAHKGQTRAQGTPYIDHPLAVMRLMQAAGITDEEVLAAAVLHDVIEDSGFSWLQLESASNKRIADTVAWLTNMKPYERFIPAPPEARLIKVFDRLHNLSELHLTGDPKRITRYLEDTAWLVDALQLRERGEQGDGPHTTDRL